MSPSPPPAQHADPFLAASLTAPGALDRALVEVVRPLHDHLLALDQSAYLWVMRYGKGGEHVKIRLHGPASLAEPMRRALEEKATPWLTELPAGEPPGEPSAAAQAAPSVDPEDDEPWDGGLRWTTYQRNYINLAGPPWLDDGGYAALATECLGRGCTQILTSLQLGRDGKVPAPMRQQILLRLLIAGLGALGFETGRRHDYLRYHRDWLIRFCLPPGSTASQQEMVRGRFDLQVRRMAPAVAQIGSAVGSLWTGNAARDEGPDGPSDPFCDALARLCRYAEGLGEDPRFQIDPLTRDAVFSPLFKALHGLGNQVGIPPLEEAFCHHLLLHASGAESNPG